MGMWAKADKPVNWVANKAACTPIAALNLFESHFQYELSEMEKVLSGQEAGYRFVIKRESPTELLVLRVSEGKGHYESDKERKKLQLTSFAASSPNKIYVEYKDALCYLHERLIIVLKWNFEKAACEFEIDEKCLGLWEVSQKTLYDLFFRKNFDESKTHFSGNKSFKDFV